MLSTRHIRFASGISLLLAFASAMRAAPDARDTADFSAFRPAFTILFRADDPKIAMRPAGITGVPYNVPTWQVDASRAAKTTATRDITQGGDGFDERILDGAMRNRAFNLFDAADHTELTGAASGNTFAFPDTNPAVRLTATLDTDAAAFPTLTITATRKRDGWLSIGYTGAPAVADADAREAWQPLIWTERRFPSLPYLTTAHMSPLPAAFVRNAAGTLYGIVADPGELPFQPLPTFDNSRFGIALRTPEKTLRPMLFFPMLGGAGSYGKAGEILTFKLRLVALRDTDVTAAFEKIARELYDFRDRRHNALGTLNAALTRIIDYGMSKYSYWNAPLRGCGYSTDVPGAVKNVSSLNPLELALVTGRAELFNDRARPILEYLFSREKFLFSLDPKQKIQSPSRALLGPCAPVSEFAALHDISHGNTNAFIETARALYPKDRVINLDDVSRGPTWWNALALYRATGEKHWLDLARRGADAYIARRVDKPSASFQDPDGQGTFFWTGFVPRWIDLAMLHEATGEKRYLEAARRGARLNALYIWMCPLIPDTDITVNTGNKAPVYWYLGRRGFPAIPCPEETAPAWRLSEQGLNPESSGTATGHRAIFMAHHAPWMLRIATLTGDTFLHDIARSAVIGRYRSFPGYHINTARTTVYEKADYALRPHEEMSYNSIHYNHVWPMASMILDYLVSDAVTRSRGAIDFPDQYIEGYAYLQSRFYGHCPGKIYDIENLNLWLPDNLVTAGSNELNYIAAHDAAGAAIVFTNQSFSAVTARVRLNPACFSALPGGARVRVYQENKYIRTITCDPRDGIPVEVAASGITALYIEGAKPAPGWTPGRDLAQPITTGIQKLSPGDARAITLSLGDRATWLYAYLREDDSKWSRAALRITTSATTTTLTADSFPYEFSQDLTSADGYAPKLNFTATPAAPQK